MNKHSLKVLEYGKLIQMLAEKTESAPGRELALNLEPLTSRQNIQRLINETTELKQALENCQYFPVSGVSDLTPILDRLSDWNQPLTIDEICQVAATLQAGRSVVEILNDVEPDSDLGVLRDGIGDFSDIRTAIDKTIGGDRAVKDAANSHLKSLRNRIQILRKRVREKMASMVHELGISQYLSDDNIRESDYRPTLAVSKKHLSRIEGVKRGRSDSGKTVYIEPQAVKRLGDELEELLYEEKLEVQRILLEITGMIAERRKDISASVDILARLDLTYAKVRLSREFGMCPPALNSSGVIRLVNARHPLLIALTGDNSVAEPVVPIDVQLGDRFNTLIITGPNTGGKTVSLKVTGLLTLMALSGLHIPASEDSTVAVFSSVWADIGDEQSIEQSLSTFSSHLSNIGSIMNSADSNSLILLDELGGGTDPVEGAALASAILEYLHQKNARVAVTTHISQLKKLGYQVSGMENASIEFDLETLKPTYKLRIGHPGKSNALVLALRLGLPDEVISKAGAYKPDDSSDEMVDRLQATLDDISADREAAKDSRRRIEEKEDELRSKERELIQKLDSIKNTPGEEVFSFLVNLREEVHSILSSDSSKRSLLAAFDNIHNRINHMLENQDQEEDADQIVVGDKVKISNLGKTGEVERVAKNGELTVLLGGMTVSVSADEVRKKG